MELLEIVNEEGKYTGEVVERDDAHNRNLLHNEVSVFIINNKGEILLQKRSLNKRYKPGKWSSCAGHVCAFETVENTAIREVFEEISVKIEVDELVKIGDREIIIREDNSRVSYSYYVRKDVDLDKVNLQEEEVSAVKWFLIDDIIEMIKNNDEGISFEYNRLGLFLKLKDIIGN